jgi:hypothetical protein
MMTRYLPNDKWQAWGPFFFDFETESRVTKGLQLPSYYEILRGSCRVGVIFPWKSIWSVKLPERLPFLHE